MSRLPSKAELRRRERARARGGTLLVLPPIGDDLPTGAKNALALRNACSMQGRCPSCGAEGEIRRERLDPANVLHLVFEHEEGCPASDEGLAAALEGAA